MRCINTDLYNINISKIGINLLPGLEISIKVFSLRLIEVLAPLQAQAPQDSSLRGPALGSGFVVVVPVPRSLDGDSVACPPTPSSRRIPFSSLASGQSLCGAGGAVFSSLGCSAAWVSVATLVAAAVPVVVLRSRSSLLNPRPISSFPVAAMSFPEPRPKSVAAIAYPRMTSPAPTTKR